MIKLFFIISYILVAIVVGGYAYNWLENDYEDPEANSIAAFAIGLGWSVVLPILILGKIIALFGKLCAWMGGFMKGIKRK